MDLSPLQIPRSGRSRTRSSRLLKIAFIALALLAAGLVAREPLTKALVAGQGPEVRVIAVERQSPLALTALRGTAANGYVVAARRAALSADAPGRIVELRVTEGSRVEKGELVARLYQDELRAALAGAEARVVAARAEADRAAAEIEATVALVPGLERAVEAASAAIDAETARLALARSDLKRQDELADRNVSSARARDEAQSQFDGTTATRAGAVAAAAETSAAVDAARARTRVARASHALAEAGVATAEADRDLARASLDKTEVRAPFAGLVVLKDAEVGEVVSPNVQGGSNARGAICTLVDLDSLEVQVEVPETSLSKVIVGAPARIFLDAYPAEPYAGRVARIWPTANRQKGTVEVRVAFESRDERLRPELGLRVVFLAEADLEDEAALGGSSDAMLVPKTAVLERGGARGVQRVDDGRVRFVPLELGPERFGRVLVQRGLEPGERILATALTELADGAAVRAVDP